MHPFRESSVHKLIHEESSQDDIDFVTLGTLIIDEIEYPSPVPPVKGILGGAASYSVLGARLFSPPPKSSKIGWIVDHGSDFPADVLTVIESWNTSAIIRDESDRLTTRGLNDYIDEAGLREFKYMTPKKRITAEDLSPRLLQSRSFHLICSPTRCQELVADIISLRKTVLPKSLYTRPIFIWEPVPDMCTPNELLNCTNTLPLVDICSPNHSELAGFMGDSGFDPTSGLISTSAVERACEQLLASMPLQSYTLVVRAGIKGCYIAKNGGRKRMPAKANAPARVKDYTRGGLQPDTDVAALFAGLLCDADGMVLREDFEVDPGIGRWIPAFHQDNYQVVDPTGGGNTFLGALGVALARGNGVEESAVWGSVAASFAIEQVGMPSLIRHDDGSETWNGQHVLDRLHEFQGRL